MKFILLLGLVAMASSAPNTRITSSIEVTSDQEVPFQVSISNLGFHCGGVLIDPQWVLTSTSCVAGLFEQVAYVRVGSRYHNYGGKEVGIAKIITNPLFSRETLNNDIALVKLVESVSLSATVKVAKLAQPGDVLKPNEFIQISGWGIESQATGLNPALLRKAAVTYQRTADCATAYKSEGVILPSRTICAGLIENSGPAICEGDVGGPAYSLTDELLYGISSFALKCGSGPNRPSVFTDVREYGDWIHAVIYPPA